MGSLADEIHENLEKLISPWYADHTTDCTLTTNHILRRFREDMGLVRNDYWQTFLQQFGQNGSLNDLLYYLVNNFDSLYNEEIGLWLPGLTTDYVSTPDDASLDITGDICIVVDFYTPTGTPGSNSTLVSKWNTTGDQRSYRYYMGALGKMVFAGTSDGITTRSSTSVDAISGPGRYKKAVTLNITTDIATHWTYTNGTWILDSNVALTSALSALFVGTAQLQIGRVTSADPFQGVVYSAEVYNGIGDNSQPGLGTLVASPRFTSPVEPRLRDSIGKIWTINGSAWAWS